MQVNRIIDIEVNGRKLKCNSDRTVMQVCEENGDYIPRFCYNEKLTIVGNCRMCLVEIEKHGKMMPACAVKVQPFMGIWTESLKIKKSRENVMEFLLVNHPLDCPICDQGGECDLQDQAMLYGRQRGRYSGNKKSKKEFEGSIKIKAIMTRCIQCTRCVRYGIEIGDMDNGERGRSKNIEI